MGPISLTPTKETTVTPARGLLTILLCIACAQISGANANLFSSLLKPLSLSKSAKSDPDISNTFSDRCSIPVVPLDPDLVQPDIYFFSSKGSPDNGGLSYDERFLYNDTEDVLRASAFESKWPTYFIIHGFMASWDSDPWMADTKDLILDNSQGANVFLIDWSRGSKPLILGDYPRAVSSTQVVGDMLSKFVRTLSDATHAPPESIHIVGHSLGAHIAGTVGKNLANLGRITALDPAGPCYSENNEDKKDEGSHRLSKDDAIVVTALHTNTHGFGINQNLAHFDTYINGGDNQPGCPTLKGDVFEALTLQVDNLLSSLDISCSHSYSHELITPDLERCQLMSYKCKSYKLFKKGECGQCNERNDLCHLSEFSLQSYVSDSLTTNGSINISSLVPEERQFLYKLPLSKDRDKYDSTLSNRKNDDDQDDADLDEDENYEYQAQQNSSNSGKPIEDDDNVNGEPRYYVRTSSSEPYCREYKTRCERSYLVIELDKKARQFKPTYYIELIRNRTTKFERNVSWSEMFADTWNPPTVSLRTIKVKHLVSSWYREQHSLGENDDAMTALITFRYGRKTGKDGRILKRPIKFNEIKLFSEQIDQLEWVKRVQINYMSNVDYLKRQSLSSEFQVPTGESIQSLAKKRKSSASWSLTSCLSGLLTINITKCDSQRATYYELGLKAQTSETEAHF